MDFERADGLKVNIHHDIVFEDSPFRKKVASWQHQFSLKAAVLLYQG